MEFALVELRAQRTFRFATVPPDLQLAAVVSAMLVDYRADGSTRLVTRGWADPQNHKSISKTTPISTAEAYTLKFELQPHDYEF